MKKTICLAAMAFLLAGCGSASHLAEGRNSKPIVIAQEPCPDDLTACTYGNSENGNDTNTEDQQQQQK
jgi:hypothetical protein